jgi:hypothetical protein
MTLDKRAKVVRPSRKHSPHQLSIIDLHVLQFRVLKLVHIAEYIYSSTCRKFHDSQILGDSRFDRVGSESEAGGTP